MKKAIISGTFDPITVGHIDLIKRAREIFDEVVVVILSNGEKSKCMFSPDERCAIAKAAVSSIDGASVLLWEGLTSDAAKKVGAKFIVRGARSSSDFDYENGLAAIMKRFDDNLETVILPSSPELSMISSTYVRERIKYACDLTGDVPDECIPLIEKYRKAEK